MSLQKSACVAAIAAILLLALGPLQASEFPVADFVVVEKGARKLHLMRGAEPFRSFDIALGIVPNGDKEREGDFRTPEGRYLLDMRNPNSEFFLSIHISYPSQQDRREARARGENPGGAIMIHGQPNVPTKSEAYYRTQDWTNGCIAVSNSDMIDIWLMTGENTPIEIRP
ncbi:MAG: L,D-transpeptidase family protein [Gammaproteobacteria bacterium]|nr:L,D-transpeptidase family protein [Gammaproteobacteria bacterium]